jgi:hypothetical protein
VEQIQKALALGFVSAIKTVVVQPLCTFQRIHWRRQKLPERQEFRASFVKKKKFI